MIRKQKISRWSAQILLTYFLTQLLPHMIYESIMISTHWLSGKNKLYFLCQKYPMALPQSPHWDISNLDTKYHWAIVSC